MVYQHTLPPPTHPPPPLASITPSSQLPVLHIPNRQRKHRLKIEFTFFNSPSRLFQITLNSLSIVALLALNSYERYPSSERDRKFRRYSFTASMKFQSRKFQVVVVQGREGDVPKSVLHPKCFLSMTNVTTPLLLFWRFRCRWTHCTPSLSPGLSLSLSLLLCKREPWQRGSLYPHFFWDLTRHVFWGGAGEL